MSKEEIIEELGEIKCGIAIALNDAEIYITSYTIKEGLLVLFNGEMVVGAMSLNIIERLEVIEEYEKNS